ncbi:MAG: FAD-dependent oxidoreductase [Geminicoccaceae bacterium]|nr:FAD-dependent oxidoreductase [Geminicoccaceae bacterium]
MSVLPAVPRRDALRLLAGGLALAAATQPASATAPVRSSARIVVLGAGAAGTAIANRLVRRLDGASITLVDKRREHLYQPGFSLVAAGLKPASYVVDGRTRDWLPAGVRLLEDEAAEIDPEARRVTTRSGTALDYDFLIVATGLELNWGAIEGFSLELVGENGIGALYAGPEYAERTARAVHAFAQKGGTAILTRPNTEMKCAGAPIKHTFLVEDIVTTAGKRDDAEIVYCSNSKVLFSVPIVSEKVRMLFGERGIGTRYEHVLKAIDPARRIAVFDTPEGKKELGYDYLHVVPPMRAPEVVRNSPLPWADKWKGQYWVEVDQQTLRHRRYPEIFAIGDVAGVPKGKTAASVKWQVPVVEDHLVAQIQGREGRELYNGYTSCPLITRVGRAMLIEFDYKDNLTPSFPGVIAPLEELWISWLMKEIALKPTYNAMLRGLA